MLTIEEATKKGIDICKALLGHDILEKYKQSACVTVSRVHGGMFCGISVIIDDTQKPPKMRCAECKVNLQSGEVIGANVHNEGGNHLVNHK